MAGHNVRDYFQIVTEDGKEKAECRLCGRTITNNVGCMRWHFAMHERQGTSATPHREEEGSECPEEGSPPDASDTKPPPDLIRIVDRDDVVLRTLKYLAVCPSERAFDIGLHDAPDVVIETICDAAYNVHEGPVTVTEPYKNLFRAHWPAIETLTSPTSTIEERREAIESQTGGFAFLPILISAALGALGTRLFGGS